MPDQKSLVKLSNWEQAKKAIELCKTIDEVKQIRDQAEVLRAYAKQAKESLEVQNNVAEIKLRAEKRIGEFSKQLPVQRGKSKMTPHDGESFKTDILKNAGIGIKHANRYEAIASLPDDVFEDHIQRIKQSNEELTTVGIIKIAKELEKNNRINLEKQQRNQEVSSMEIRKGDFKDALKDVFDIDAIITDPPYPYEFIECFSDLAIFAKEHLKENGFVAVYSGQYHLPEVINRLSAHLTYVWTFCLYHVGKKQLVNGVNIMCGWKPVLIFSKGKKKMRFSAYDVLISKQMEKANHEWQQSESGVESLIEIFSKPNDLIVDPFAGSGTFGVVANKMGRKFIGAEIQ